MKTSITVFTCALLLAGSAAQGQNSQNGQAANAATSAPVIQNSWQIGWGNSTVTATLDNGTLTISGTGQMYVQPSRYSSGFIPWYDQKDRVTAVIINNGVTNISAAAFADHTNLRSVSIPASVASIGRSAFSNCSLTGITIPNSVTQIDDDAFSGNSGLTKVVLEDGKTTLNFGNYGNGNVFVNCPIDVLYLGRNMSWFNDYGVHGNSPFKNNTKLRSVTIGNHVTSIGGAAFYGCTELTSVKLGNSISSIGSAAFQYTGITSIILPEGVTKIGIAAFANSELTGIKIPAGVSAIGDDAFAACGRLKSVILEEGKIPLQLGDKPFDTTPIETLYIGRNIQGAWNVLFSKNVKLRSVTFGDKVTTIGSCAFSGCTGLTRAIIGAGITSIESWAFQFTELKEIQCKNPTPPSAGKDCFDGVNKTGCKLYITAGSQNAYRTANEWKDFFIVLNQPTATGKTAAGAQPEATATGKTTADTQPVVETSLSTSSSEQSISTQSKATTLPVVEILQVWGTTKGGPGDGVITPIGLLKYYGSYPEPQKMIALIKSKDGSWLKQLTVNGPIYKSGDSRNNTGLYQGAYKIGSITVPKTGDYTVIIGVDIGVIIDGSRIVWSNSETYYVKKDEAPQSGVTPPPTPTKDSPASSTITYPSTNGMMIEYGDVQVKGASTASVSTKIHLRNTTKDKRVDLGAGTCDNCGKQISTNNSVNNPISFTIQQSKLIGGDNYRLTVETENGNGVSTWTERTFTLTQASYAKITAPASDGQFLPFNDVKVTGSSTQAKQTKIHLRNTTTDKRVDLGEGEGNGKLISNTNQFSFTIPKSKLVAGDSYRIAIETIHQNNTSSWNERTFIVALQETVAISISDDGGVWHNGSKNCVLYLPKNEAYHLYKALTRTDLIDWAINTGISNIMDKALAFDAKLSLMFKGLNLINEAFKSAETGSFAQSLDKMDKSTKSSFVCITASNFQSGGVDYAVREYKYAEKTQIKFSSGQFIPMSKLTAEDLKNFFFKGFNK